MSDYEEEELIDYSKLTNRKNKHTFLKRGNKLNDNKQVDSGQLENARQALFSTLQQQENSTIPNGKNICRGILDTSTLNCWTRTTVAKGTHLHTMGFAHEGNITLYPEEAAFLVSRNSMHVVMVKKGNEETVATFEDFCEILCESKDGWITFEKYQVYAYLKRLGYIVMRSTRRSAFEKCNDPSDNAEKQLEEESAFKVIFDRVTAWLRQNDDKNNRPLVWDYRCTNFHNVYSTLQIIPTTPWYKPLYKSLHRATFDWDVYKPRASWKKRDPGVPDFQIAVRSIHDPVPSLYEQNQLFSLLLNTQNTNYQPSRKTELRDYGPTFVMALTGDAEGIVFLRMIGDGLADISK